MRSRKYDSLKDYLAKQEPTLTLRFTDIERIIGDTLPAAAHRHRPWWGNQISNPSSRQCYAWLDAGWEVDTVDLARETVRFRKR
jgi:hypothetical protein